MHFFLLGFQPYPMSQVPICSPFTFQPAQQTQAGHPSCHISVSLFILLESRDGKLDPHEQNYLRFNDREQQTKLHCQMPGVTTPLKM